VTARERTRPAGRGAQGGGTSRRPGWLHPQDYSGEKSYRSPAGWYRRLNPIGVPLTTWGLAPRDAVTLEVRGRRTGRPRRIPILVTRHGGADHLVALAGESQWVRNVRAAGGEAALRRRGTRWVRLEELPVAQRAPVLAAYLEAGRRRSGEAAAREQAKWYFGVDGPATPERLAELAPRYPVFRVLDTPAAQHDEVPVREIAPGVVCMGPWGRTQTNVYLIRGTTGWVLVDAGWPGDADRIEAATKQVLGPDQRPEAVVLTHVHPDHSGAARELSGRWSCPVFVHPEELPIASGDYDAMWKSAGPLDRWVVLPAMWLIGRRRREKVLGRNTVGQVAHVLPPGAPAPGLPEWEVVATPGHTPGHISLHRPADGVLIAGDALVNLRLDSVLGLLRGQPGLSGPPWYTTWSPAAAVDSIQDLAALGSSVVGPGHGPALTRPDTASRVRGFAATLGTRAPGAHAGADAERSTPVARIAGEVLIDAAITEVFDAVADERNEPRYNPRIVRAEMLTDEPVRAGSRFVAEPKGMGARNEMILEIMEYQRPHRLHNVIRSSYMHVDGTLTFTETEVGTRLRWDWTMRLVGPMRLLTPVLRLVGPRWERRNWIDLKDYHEGRSR
jgi:glyoxylase-like metal-dependent hydrolase (beta-lactamase superfamily II)